MLINLKSHLLLGLILVEHFAISDTCAVQDENNNQAENYLCCFSTSFHADEVLGFILVILDCLLHALAFLVSCEIDTILILHMVDVDVH